jgi:membrane fusion protein, multidrug efflux system
MPPRKRLFSAAVFGLVLGLVSATGCLDRSEGSHGTKSSLPTVPVVTGVAIRKEVPLEIRSFGRVEASSTIAVKSQVSGELVEVGFAEGDEVHRGQILFSIDPRPYAAALARAEAALARDTAQVRNAELEVKRLRDLLTKDYLSQDEFDRAVTTAEALAATVRADGAAVESAKVDLGYCSIRSPVDGFTGRLLVTRGNVVKANSDGPLVEIAQIRPVHVSFSVPEKGLPEIRRRRAEGRLPVRASIPDSDGAPSVGELSLIDNAVDRATGMILIEASFENADGLLWPGQYVDVSLRLSSIEGAVVAPTRAVGVGQKGAYVFAIKEEKAELRPVTVRSEDGGETVIAEGLEAGEEIVLEGQVRLVPGSPIERKAPAPATPGTRP